MADYKRSPAQNRARQRTRDLRVMQSHKMRLGKSCAGCGVVCGYNRTAGEIHPELFHYHHVDPANKTGGVSRMLLDELSWSRVIQEMQKCALLCVVCHGHIHAAENDAARSARLRQ